MTNTIELKKALIEAGVSQRKLSAMTGISVNSLNRKINNRAPFCAREITEICDCLGITDPQKKCTIFLA